MSSGNADAVVFVLVDALRADYVGRTTYLQQVADRSVTGRLEEPFGFWPHGAYFGGLSVAQQGFTNLYQFDPARSVFAWTRALKAGDSTERMRLWHRDAIVSRARAELPSWSAAYVDPLSIPLSRLSSFDVSARHPAWSREVGYRSLFHVLDDARMPWLELSWPFEGRHAGVTSSRIAGDAITALRPDHRFAFIHLPDLDLAGHLFGPGSIALQAKLDETDKLCEKIAARVMELYRDPIVVFAGDHGMLPVVQAVDAERALADTGLRWGYDFAYFIDSTMVRCWFFTSAARRRGMAALASLGGGHFLSHEEQDRFELTGIDPKNGEEIFIADPGVVFTPNYFNWSDQLTLKGMHGYAPDVPDNRAGLLVYRPRDHARGDVGVIQARRLFPAFLQWLGLDYRSLTSVDPIPSPTSCAPRWTASGDAGSERLIGAHISRITKVLQERVPAAEAIVLTGSFGRGEGSVVGGIPSGGPVNDYDLIAIGADATQLGGVGAALAQELGIDFVDILVVPQLEASESPSQFDYDVRYGSRVLAGDPTILDRLPLYAPAQVSREDGALEVGNRTGGLLLGLTGCFSPVDSAGQFLARQTMKFLIAIADCWLIAGADYHPSYAVRRERFGALARAAGFTPQVATSIDGAFSAKLGGSSAVATSAEESAVVTLTALRELERALEAATESQTFDALLGRGVRLRMSEGSRDWINRARVHGLCSTPCATQNPSAAVSSVYDACLCAVRSWSEGPHERAVRVESVLAPYFTFRPEQCDAPIVTAVARSWFSLFH